MPERRRWTSGQTRSRSEEHTSELQSHSDLVCRLLLEKKKNERDSLAVRTRCPHYTPSRNCLSGGGYSESSVLLPPASQNNSLIVHPDEVTVGVWSGM